MLAGFAQNFQSFQAESLKIVGRRSRLVGSAAEHGRTGALYRARCAEQLLARFDGAGSGDDYDAGSADGGAAYVYNCALGLDLPAHQFEGLRDRDYVVHAGRNLQRLDFVAASVSHGGDDGAFDSARDVRLVAGLANALDDVRNLLFGGFLRHVDDHWLSPE